MSSMTNLSTVLETILHAELENVDSITDMQEWHNGACAVLANAFTSVTSTLVATALVATNGESTGVDYKSLYADLADMVCKKVDENLSEKFGETGVKVLSETLELLNRGEIDDDEANRRVDQILGETNFRHHVKERPVFN